MSDFALEHTKPVPRSLHRFVNQEQPQDNKVLAGIMVTFPSLLGFEFAINFRDAGSQRRSPNGTYTRWVAF